LGVARGRSSLLGLVALLRGLILRLWWLQRLILRLRILRHLRDRRHTARRGYPRRSTRGRALISSGRVLARGTLARRDVRGAGRVARGTLARRDVRGAGRVARCLGIPGLAHRLRLTWPPQRGRIRWTPRVIVGLHRRWGIARLRGLLVARLRGLLVARLRGLLVALLRGLLVALLRGLLVALLRLQEASSAPSRSPVPSASPSCVLAIASRPNDRPFLSLQQ
jgi:hypothetical protein